MNRMTLQIIVLIVAVSVGLLKWYGLYNDAGTVPPKRTTEENASCTQDVYVVFSGNESFRSLKEWEAAFD